MDENIYVYFIRLPEGINEIVVPCFNGYTVYIDSSLSDYGREKAYKHALHHISNNDFEKADVQEIEAEAHRRT